MTEFRSLPRGKRPPKGAPSLKFASFHATASETYPPVDYLADYTVEPMDGNDQYGDCVAVGWANTRGLVTKVLTGTEFNATLDQVEELYKTQNPGFPTDDNGMDIQTMLEYLVSLGADSPFGHLVAFAQVDHANIDEMKAAISVAGSILIGEIVTDTQQQEFPGDWTYDENGANPGGHCTVGGGHSDQTSAHVIRQATWADFNWLDQEFVQKAFDEAWVLIWAEHLGSAEFVAGMDLQTLAADLSAITDGKLTLDVPTPDPAPEPTPAPTAELAITAPTAGEVLTSATVGISGTAPDGAVVIYDGDATLTTASATGGLFTATVTLVDGDHSLWFTAGNGDSPAVAVTVSSQPDPSPEPTPEPTPEPAPEPDPEPVPDAPVIVSPLDGETVTGTVVVAGTGAAPDTILLYDGDTQINVNPIDISDDVWTINLALEPGDHTLTATERNAFGNLSDGSAAVTVTVQAVPEPPPVSDPDAHLAHFLRHRIIDAGQRPTWETWVELRQHARAWLEARDL